LVELNFSIAPLKPSTEYLREERSRTSRLERQDEMRVHENDSRRFIIDLGKANFLHPTLYFSKFLRFV
jgi:hypothetical protein